MSLPHEEQTLPEAASSSSFGQYQFFNSSMCYYKLRVVFGIPWHLIKMLAQENCQVITFDISTAYT